MDIKDIKNRLKKLSSHNIRESKISSMINKLKIREKFKKFTQIKNEDLIPFEQFIENMDEK